ncbi:MAG: hypothetical protein JWP00_873 [Chloroflexi bacterium]|nr:hypothetical protein [Chloroflexota bacterium]
MENTSDRETGLVELNGVPFYYEVAGLGHPVIWLHAGIADSRMWDNQFELFKHGYEVARFDQRGFGRTPKGQGPFSYKDDLAKFIDFLGFPKVALVGCSMGGRTIIDYTLDNPERVAGLVTVCGGLSGYNPEGEIPPAMRKLWDEMDAAEAAQDIDKIADLEVRIWVDGPRAPGEVDPAVREKVRKMAAIAAASAFLPGKEEPAAHPAANRLGEIKVPLLALAGEFDNLHVHKTADKLAAEVPGAVKVILPGTNHLPNMEKPEEFNREVMLFLGSLGNYAA